MKKLKHKSQDGQIVEFEKNDIGNDFRKSGSAVVVKRRQLPTSILLDPDLISQLRTKAKKRHIGYQTMMKIIVAENVARY